ncbi:MAG: radical SAM protein [Dehalococcoidales bacterium]|nr:MAG: radical SAM protein [Dehalococcoidales bacterium]
MRFQKVLLVNPAHHVEWPGLTPPIGPGYLTETLKCSGIEYDVLDMNLGYGVKQLRQKLNHFQPDLVGMGMITRDYRRFYSTLEEIKQHNSKIKIVAGGPHVTIFKEQVLQECQAIDYGITREGERALVELCQDEIAEENVKGLLYRENGDIIYAGDREFITDLDGVPWPRYEKFELGKYFHEISIHSSRGCPYQCIFCARHCLTPIYQARSAENVGAELEYWYRKGYRQFNIEDDNFNLIQQRVYAICDEIERRQLRGLVLRCSNGIRADRIDRDMLARMRKVGFKYLAFGVDAGNDRMLKVVKKSETMEDIENGIRNACELGYSIKLFFIIGCPTETPEDVEDMVRLSRKYPIQEVHFNNVVPYPGTELYDWIKDNDYFLRQPDEYLNNASFWEKVPIFETPEMPEAERIRLTKYLHEVRKEVHREAMRRILQRFGVIGTLASHILANSFLEQLYYKSRFWRKILEGFRYRLSSGKRALTKTEN